LVLIRPPDSTRLSSNIPVSPKNSLDNLDTDFSEFVP
jgi:hypothetical protein